VNRRGYQSLFSALFTFARECDGADSMLLYSSNFCTADRTYCQRLNWHRIQSRAPHKLNTFAGQAIRIVRALSALGGRTRHMRRYSTCVALFANVQRLLRVHIKLASRSLVWVFIHNDEHRRVCLDQGL
jgi:hypothetical protein